MSLVVALGDDPVPQPVSTQATDAAAVFGNDLSRIAVERVDWEWPSQPPPLISVRHGPTREGSTETKTAIGLVAIGDVAVGAVAMGRTALGILAIGARGFRLNPRTGRVVRVFRGGG